MEPSEKIAFTIVILLGMFYIAFPYINWDYKTLILQINGLLFWVWSGCVILSNVSTRYKLVKVEE